MATAKKNIPAVDTASVETYNTVVTNVQIYPFQTGAIGHIKGLAVIVLNDAMMIRGLRIMDGENGLFIGYPNDPFYKGEDFRSICQPMTRQLREHIEAVVLNKYQAIMAEC